MGKYSVNGSPEFDAQVDAHMERIADEVYRSIYSKHWKALVLHSEYGRGEGTPQIGRDGKELPFYDVELLVVTRKISPIIKRALEKMGASLSEEIGLPVHLRPTLKKKLPSYNPSFRTYALKQGHRVIRGDQNILSRMPDYSSDEIPLSEGTRLLMNHGKLLLDIKQRQSTGQPLSAEERLQAIRTLFRTTLALGDCILLLRGAYDPSPAVKKSRIDQVDLNGMKNGRGIAEAYRRAAAFKESSCFQPLETINVHVWFDETVRHFNDTFLWYERRRLNQKFRTLGKYTQRFPTLGKEGRPLKNAMTNLRTFGLGAFPDLFTHPRLRLYAALPLLLAPHSDHDEIRWVLRSNQRSIDRLSEVFCDLQQKFS
jgi:hypothetical protein